MWLVSVRPSRCGSDVLRGGHPDVEASVPEETASHCTRRISTGRAEGVRCPGARGSPASRFLRPRNAFDSAGRVAMSPRRAGYLVQQTLCVECHVAHHRAERIGPQRAAAVAGVVRQTPVAHSPAPIEPTPQGASESSRPQARERGPRRSRQRSCRSCRQLPLLASLTLRDGQVLAEDRKIAGSMRSTPPRFTFTMPRRIAPGSCPRHGA